MIQSSESLLASRLRRVYGQGLQKVFAQNQGKTRRCRYEGYFCRKYRQHECCPKGKSLPTKIIAAGAKRLQLAGSNLDLRKLEYNLRAYGTGADGQPVPGVEFDTNGHPIGTADADERTGYQTRLAMLENVPKQWQDLETRIRGGIE